MRSTIKQREAKEATKKNKTKELVVLPPRSDRIVRIKFVPGLTKADGFMPPRNLFLDDRVEPRLDEYVSRREWVSFVHGINHELAAVHQTRRQRITSVVSIVVPFLVTVACIAIYLDRPWMMDPLLIIAPILSVVAGVALRGESHLLPHERVRSKFESIPGKFHGKFGESGVTCVLGRPLVQFYGPGSDLNPSNYMTYIDLRLKGVELDEDTAASEAIGEAEDTLGVMVELEDDM